MKTIRLVVVILLVAAFICVIGKTNLQADVTAYDAGGQFLGVFNGYEQGGADIYMPSFDVNIVISFSNGDVSGLNVLYFESNDCAGIPYISADASYYIRKNGGKYYMGDKIVPLSIQVNSRNSHDGASCIQYSTTLDLVPAVEVDLSFDLPVELPLDFDLEPTHHGKWKK